MRVVYDTATGRVAALGDAVEASAGQAVAELTPTATAELAAALVVATDAEARHRNAIQEEQAARGRYRRAAEAAKEAFAAAERAARDAGGVLGFDPQRGYVTLAAAPPPAPTAEEDEALVAADPRLAALLRVLARQTAAQ